MLRKTIEIEVKLDFNNGEIDFKVNHDFEDEEQVKIVLRKMLKHFNEEE